MTGREVRERFAEVMMVKLSLQVWQVLAVALIVGLLAVKCTN
jgi:hypothetical protein